MSRHDIVVIGYNDDAGTAVVVENDRPEPQTIGHDDLARARSARGFPVPTRHTCFRLRFPTTLPDLRAAAGRACADAARGMTVAVPGLPGMDGSGAGVDGVAAFVEDLDRWADFDAAELERALFTLWVFVAKTGTGGALFRRLQAGFLVDLAGLVPDPSVYEARDVDRRLADRWSELASVAVADLSTADRTGCGARAGESPARPGGPRGCAGCRRWRTRCRVVWRDHCWQRYRITG